MKQFMTVYLMVTITLLCMEAVFDDTISQHYSGQLEQAIETAVRHSLERDVTPYSKDSLEQNQIMYCDFLQDLMLQIGGQCDYWVSIYELDWRKGVLDVGVTLRYPKTKGAYEMKTVRKRGERVS